LIKPSKQTNILLCIAQHFLFANIKYLDLSTKIFKQHSHSQQATTTANIKSKCV